MRVLREKETGVLRILIQHVLYMYVCVCIHSDMHKKPTLY